MKFVLRHELVLADLALALANRGEAVIGTTKAVEDFIDKQGKREIREHARAALLRYGEPEHWPSPNDCNLLIYAREHCNRLWPKGA